MTTEEIIKIVQDNLNASLEKYIGLQERYKGYENTPTGQIDEIDDIREDLNYLNMQIPWLQKTISYLRVLTENRQIAAKALPGKLERYAGLQEEYAGNEEIDSPDINLIRDELIDLNEEIPELQKKQSLDNERALYQQEIAPLMEEWVSLRDQYSGNEMSSNPEVNAIRDRLNELNITAIPEKRKEFEPEEDRIYREFLEWSQLESKTREEIANLENIAAGYKSQIINWTEMQAS